MSSKNLAINHFYCLLSFPALKSASRRRITTLSIPTLNSTKIYSMCDFFHVYLNWSCLFQHRNIHLFEYVCNNSFCNTSSLNKHGIHLCVCFLFFVVFSRAIQCDFVSSNSENWAFVNFLVSDFSWSTDVSVHSRSACGSWKWNEDSGSFFRYSSTDDRNFFVVRCSFLCGSIPSSRTHHHYRVGVVCCSFSDDCHFWCSPVCTYTCTASIGYFFLRVSNGTSRHDNDVNSSWCFSQ